MRLVLILTAYLIFYSAHAQDVQIDIDYMNDDRSRIYALEDDLADKERSLIRMSRIISDLEDERDSGYFYARSAYYRSIVNYYSYLERLRDRTISMLVWQVISSYLLLFVVIGIAGFGGCLAYREVMKTLPAQEALSHTREDGGGNGERVHTLVIEANRIQITSAMTGVIILVISLGFLYLFVDKVMDLNPVRLGDGVVLGASKSLGGSDATPTGQE